MNEAYDFLVRITEKYPPPERCNHSLTLADEENHFQLVVWVAVSDPRHFKMHSREVSDIEKLMADIENLI